MNICLLAKFYTSIYKATHQPDYFCKVNLILLNRGAIQLCFLIF